MGMTVGMRRVSAAEVELLLSGREPVAQLGSDDYEWDEANSLDLDKSWHGLHFLLTETVDGGDEPLCYLMHGGKDIGSDESSHERLLTPAQVADFDKALSELAPDDLRQRFNPQQMQSVYPTIWDIDPQEDDALGWLLEFYDEMRAFVAATAAQNGALIIDLSV